MWHNCWQTLVGTSQAKKTHARWIQSSLIGKKAEEGAKPGAGFILAHLILHKSALNNVFMLHWSPNYHLRLIPANLFHLSPGSVPHGQKIWELLLMSSCSVLLCSKCKSFMDPLWCFHSHCEGLQSLNSLKIKMRGTGGSNHFSTSSLCLISPHCLRRRTLHPIWQTHTGCERCF